MAFDESECTDSVTCISGNQSHPRNVSCDASTQLVGGWRGSEYELEAKITSKELSKIRVTDKDLSSHKRIRGILQGILSGRVTEEGKLGTV